MKTFLKLLGHAVLGGLAAGVASSATGAITLKSVLLPAAASALTSLISALAHSPLSGDK